MDPARRQRLSISLSSPASYPNAAKSIPSDLLLSILLTKSLLAISVHTTKVWLLSAGVSPVAFNGGFLVFGALAKLALSSNTHNEPVKDKTRSTLNIGQTTLHGVLLAVQWAAFWIAIQYLDVSRVFMLSQYAGFWAPNLLSSTAFRLSSSFRNALFLTFIAFSISAWADWEDQSHLGYLALFVHVTLHARHQAITQHSIDPQRFERTCLLIASAFSIPFALYAYIDSSVTMASDMASTYIPLTIFAASTLLLLDSYVDRTVGSHLPRPKHIRNGWLCAVLSAWFVGLVAFGVRWSWKDIGLVIFARWAINSIVSATVYSQPVNAFQPESAGEQHEKQLNLIESFALFWKKLRSVVRIILANNDSRRIYFFLCLNFGYMGVQMVWGIWTNSLGLISDSIHMFFDNAALALGLFASVMSNWPSDEVFTYGYSRVETLSGFANGLFLILISVFIVFEAIQRLMDPPEMNTHQLLTVSALGLAVNLVGLVATGGHHHHGGGSGGHSHGHSHSHSDSHSHVEHDEGGGHSGHSHNMSGVFLHVMADTLGSVGVIISTLLINRYGWTGFDPLASIFIAVLIFASVVPLVQDSGMLLCLDLGPSREEEVRKALGTLNSVEGLASYAAPRFWPKDPDTIVGSIHIQLLPSATSHDPNKVQEQQAHYHHIDKVVARVDHALRKAIKGLTALDIQVEPADGSKSCFCLT